MSILARSLPILVVATGCTHPQDVSATYPRVAMAPGAEIGSGAVDVVLNNPTGALSVAVNDNLVVDRKYSRKAHIDGVPAGHSTVHVSLGGSCEKARDFTREIDLQPGATAAITLPGGEVNDGCMVWDGLLHVAITLELVALAIVAGAAAEQSHVTSHVK
jgi:hypothetical protein